MKFINFFGVLKLLLINSNSLAQSDTQNDLVRIACLSYAVIG